MRRKGWKIFSVILLIFLYFGWLPQNGATHALPGTYNYLIIHGKVLSYRLIISGIDMCRLTHWNCSDLSSRDIVRLRKSRKMIEKRLNHGIRIYQHHSPLHLKLLAIHPLPFGFEVILMSHATTPIRNLSIHYSLLEGENPAFQSFFRISGPGSHTPAIFDILNKKHTVLIWRQHLQMPGPEKSLKQRLFNLQYFLKRDLSASWLLLGFLVAFLLGIGHAFTPGHGKTLMAAYLVGHHGRIKDAFVMGLTTTFTHTSSVILLGLIIMFFSHIMLPTTLFPWISRIAALLIIATGLYVFFVRLMDHLHPHPHPPDHEHPHPHKHGPHTPMHSRASQSHTWQAFWLSFSGGILPCPSAMAVLFAAISIGKIGYGILMIIMFSLGLGVTLVFTGVAILTTRNFFTRMERANRIIGKLDLVGPVFIILIGILFLIHGPFGSGKI